MGFTESSSSFRDKDKDDTERLLKGLLERYKRIFNTELSYASIQLVLNEELTKRKLTVIHDSFKDETTATLIKAYELATLEVVSQIETTHVKAQHKGFKHYKATPPRK